MILSLLETFLLFNFKTMNNKPLLSLQILLILMFFFYGCGAVHIYNGKTNQAIIRDTIQNGKVRTFVQNPEDSKNGKINIVPVEVSNLVTVNFPEIKGAKSAFSMNHTLQVPKGFTASIFARDLGRPQKMVIREDGTMFVSDLDGRILAIKSNGEVTPILTELVNPFGLELHKGSLYYTDETRFFRLDFDSPTSITGKSTILNKKIPEGQLHYIRPVKWMESDKMFYIAIGSTTNSDLENDNMHATLIRLSEQGGAYDVAVRGLRNTSALDVNPSTGQLWGIDQGAENISADLPTEELNVLTVGKHYGWPFLYSDNYRDPSYEKSILPKKTTAPLLQFQGLTFTTDLCFYKGNALGEEWKNSFLMTLHGSTNRTPLAGYSVVRVNCNPDGSNAKQTELVSGFVDSTGIVWGKPTGVTFSLKGDAFYVSDDYAGAIYKFFKQ